MFMRKWMVLAMCAGVGAFIGVAVGDFMHVSHAVGMAFAGAGGAVGGMIGSGMAG